MAISGHDTSLLLGAYIVFAFVLAYAILAGVLLVRRHRRKREL